jgi:hypothetical protein
VSGVELWRRAFVAVHTPKNSSSALHPHGLRKMIDSEAAALADMLLLLDDAGGAGILI